jgi:hypothetical protein
MRGSVAAILALVLLSGCHGEFDGQGVIRGSFSLGDRTLQTGWVEMIELSGPVDERCGPGECGLAAQALRAGSRWNPGTWRVVAPQVPGWRRPRSFVFVVKGGETTTIHAHYDPE